MVAERDYPLLGCRLRMKDALGRNREPVGRCLYRGSSRVGRCGFRRGIRLAPLSMTDARASGGTDWSGVAARGVGASPWERCNASKIRLITRLSSRHDDMGFSRFSLSTVRSARNNERRRLSPLSWPSRPELLTSSGMADAGVNRKSAATSATISEVTGFCCRA